MLFCIGCLQSLCSSYLQIRGFQRSMLDAAVCGDSSDWGGSGVSAVDLVASFSGGVVDALPGTALHGLVARWRRSCPQNHGTSAYRVQYGMHLDVHIERSRPVGLPWPVCFPMTAGWFRSDHANLVYDFLRAYRFASHKLACGSACLRAAGVCIITE